MDMWAAVFCLALTLVRGEDERYYKTNIKPVLGDQGGEKTEDAGFVQPLDFAAFTQQFFTGNNNFASLPFSANGDGGFDFFGAESKESKLLQAPSGGLLNFPSSPFSEQKQNSTGFVEAPRFFSQFDGQASPSSPIFNSGVKSTLPPARPTEEFSEEEEERPKPTPYKNLQKKAPYAGKSNYPAPRPGYKSDHSPTAVVYSNSEDVEVFLPRDKLLLPQINGRPKPYDGYRAASDVESQVYSTLSYPRPSTKPVGRKTFLRATPATYAKIQDRRAQTFSPTSRAYGEDFSESKQQEVRKIKDNEEIEEEDEEEEEEEVEEKPQPKSSGFKYQHDASIQVPDLVIKTYPYETPKDNDREFTADYEQYARSVPDDLEQHYGIPDFLKERYTVAATENLSKNSNCKRLEGERSSEGGKSCYICENPETGGSYEQCAYEEQPKPKQIYYSGSTSSSTGKEGKPVKYRYRRALDFQTPSSYEYFIYNDEPSLNRKARAETTFHHAPITVEPPKPLKKKTKKFKAAASKKVQRKRRPRQEQIADPSGHIEGPPASYEGPKYSYEGPSQSYEGPSASYEGPSIGYEGPDHDNYYDRTDDRIPYKNNPPLLSSFFDDLQNQKRPRRGPKSEVEEFGFKDDFASYRFGPEYFTDEDEVKPEPIKRNVFDKISTEDSKEDIKNNPATSSSNDEFFSGNVKIFKNGDVCEKKKKDSMVCMVCNNDKSGATYEQCQYTTKPNEQRYAFNRQKSYSSNKPQGDRHQRQTQRGDLFPEKSDKVEKKVLVTKVERTVFGEGNNPDEPLTSESSGYRKIRRILKSTDLVTSPSEEVESTAENQEEEAEDGPSRTESSERVEARDGIESLDEFLDKAGSNDDNFPKTGESYEDYFKRVFPEFQNYETITPSGFDPFAELKKYREDGTVDVTDYVPYEESGSEEKPVRLLDQKDSPEQTFDATSPASKRDVDHAYGEFNKRDWSKCKKVQHDKLTCYQCLDKNGIKNEECMYVNPGEPVKTHTSYHERKEYDPVAGSVAAYLDKNNTNPTTTESFIESNREEITASAQETVQQEKLYKGDVGIERVPEKPRRQKKPSRKTKTEDQEQIRKKGKPIKKYQSEGEVGSWDSKKADKVDESVIKIYLNDTKPDSS